MRTQLWRFLTIFALASSLPCFGQVLKGSKPAEEGPASPNRLLLPSSAFAGGILTGYVIGPDNRPVANAQVTVNGGMLMGEVIGDPVKKEEKRPTTSGGPWMPSNQFGPEYGRPVPFSDWQRTAIDFCKAGPGGSGNNPGPPDANPGPPEGNPGPPERPSFQWETGQPAGGDSASPQWGGFTNAAGGFLICVPPGAQDVQVSLPGSGEPVAVPLSPPGATRSPSAPPSFCNQGQHFDLAGAFPHASAEQDGKTSDLAVVMAIAPGGEAVSTVECPPDLHPGPLMLSLTDGSNRTREYQAHIFRFVDGNIDHAHLVSGQPADFWYDVQMGPEEAGKSLCLQVTVAGPVVLTKPPARRFKLDGTGRARVSGKIRATHVAPGTTIPFVIHPSFFECGG